MHINELVFWGTYDPEKPRVRILIEGLVQNGVHVTENNANVWRDVDDKSIISLQKLLLVCLNLVFQYPKLIFRFMRLPKHSIVVVSYMGHIDIVILWLFAKLRGTIIIWDVFISLYNTIVEERKIVKNNSIVAKLIYLWERLATKLPHLLITDTVTHGQYFVDTFHLPKNKVQAVYVGAQSKYFSNTTHIRTSNESSDHEKPLKILFYGQLSPLHGSEIIIHAANILKRHNIEWLIIGNGQDSKNIDTLINEYKTLNIKRIAWIKYDKLIDEILESDIVLGIFSDSDKASRVIPNKVFQAILAGKRIITRDSPAMRELVEPNAEGFDLITPNDPSILANTILKYANDRSLIFFDNSHELLKLQIKEKAIGKQFLQKLKELK